MTDAPPITVETIAASEALLGVRYSAAERALMADNLAPQIALAARRREMALPHTLAPALRFDPRLPDFQMPQVAPFAWVPGGETPVPAADEDIAYAPVTELAGWIRRGALTAARLTRIYLARIERFNPLLLCFARVTAEAALRRAGELDALLAEGTWLGPLHGIPYGMKDLIDTAGVETDWGAEPYRGRVPAEDAHVTTLLHRAGAVLLGKTTLGALAYGDIWHGGQTRNPWNLSEGSSGSSAGSAAAVAAGLAGFAIGSETLGSIVSPATRCGATGLRPTFGRVSRRGAMPLCWSTDKIGPLCRAVADTALVLDALNGADPRDPFQIAAPLGSMAGPLAGLRVGYFPADFEDAEAHELDRAALDAVRELGLALTPLPRRDLPYDSLMAVIEADCAAVFEALTLSGQDDQLSWQDAEAWPNTFRKARFLSAVDYVQTDRLRRLVMEEMDEHFAAVDMIIGPSLIGPMLMQTNFSGHPCLCLPIGLRAAPARGLAFGREPPPQTELHDVPHSVCLWGPLFDEGPMLAVGTELETRFGMARRRPPL